MATSEELIKQRFNSMIPFLEEQIGRQFEGRGARFGQKDEILARAKQKLLSDLLIDQGGKDAAIEETKRQEQVAAERADKIRAQNAADRDLAYQRQKEQQDEYYRQYQKMYGFDGLGTRPGGAAEPTTYDPSTYYDKGDGKRYVADPNDPTNLIEDTFGIGVTDGKSGLGTTGDSATFDPSDPLGLKKKRKDFGFDSGNNPAPYVLPSSAAPVSPRASASVDPYAKYQNFNDNFFKTGTNEYNTRWLPGGDLYQRAKTEFYGTTTDPKALAILDSKFNQYLNDAKSGKNPQKPNVSYEEIYGETPPDLTTSEEQKKLQEQKLNDANAEAEAKRKKLLSDTEVKSEKRPLNDGDSAVAAPKLGAPSMLLTNRSTTPAPATPAIPPTPAAPAIPGIKNPSGFRLTQPGPVADPYGFRSVPAALPKTPPPGQMNDLPLRNASDQTVAPQARMVKPGVPLSDQLNKYGFNTMARRPNQSRGVYA